VGTEEKDIVWMPDAAPSGALAAVSVFDSQCAPVYVREKTDVAFRPFGLDLFDRLSTACAALRERLEREQTALSMAAPVIPTVSGGTKVASLLTNLTSLTKPDDLRALATLSEAEDRCLRELRDRQRDLQTTDPKKRAQELGLKANRVDLVANHVARLTAVLGKPGLDSLHSTAAALHAARNALALLRTKVLTPGLLPGTGEDVWRKMWDAGGEFARVAYPKDPFPVISDGAQCLLCQQLIHGDAVNRFKNFQEFVSSTTQDEVRKTETAYARVLSDITQAVIDREEVGFALDEIEADEAVLAKRAREFLKDAARAQEAVSNATAKGKPLPTETPAPTPETDLRMLVRTLRDRAEQLRKQTSTMDARDAAELQELEARATLKEHLQTVLNEIERKKRVAAYAQCIEDTNTNAITRKSTDLTTRLITKRLQDEFQTELTKLEFSHLAVEIRGAGGAKGALFHQLAFKNAPGVVVARVVSEGESRTLSLAAFLTELSTAPACSAIIFDDPVSSLDHVWRQRIARRLVLEAKTRQVIVFTHDLLFLRFILDECVQQAVQVHHQYLRRDGQGSGVCSSDLPWVATPVKQRLGILRVRWQAADKAFRIGGADAYEQEARDIYGLLRETWEQAIGEVLLNDVVERYRHSIETKRVRYLHDITEDDCSAVEVGMTECSRWMRGHDHPPADGTPFPQPGDLLKRIEGLEEWVQRIRKRREGKKT
jgi:hypothetical protein